MNRYGRFYAGRGAWHVLDGDSSEPRCGVYGRPFAIVVKEKRGGPPPDPICRRCVGDWAKQRSDRADRVASLVSERAALLRALDVFAGKLEAEEGIPKLETVQLLNEALADVGSRVRLDVKTDPEVVEAPGA